MSFWSRISSKLTGAIKTIASVFTPPPQPKKEEEPIEVSEEDLEDLEEDAPIVRIVNLPAPKPTLESKWEAVFTAEERFAQILSTRTLEQIQIDDERRTAAAMGTPSSGLGHPGILPPLELLIRYEKLTEDQALSLLQNSIKNNTLDQIMESLRAKHTKTYRNEILSSTPTPKTPPSLPIQPFIGLNGSQIRFEGDLNDALRFVFDKWISSPWSGATSPPTVEVVIPDGQIFQIPTEIFRKGASQVIYWLDAQLNAKDWWQGKTSTVSVIGWKEAEYKLFQQAQDLTDRMILR